MFLFIDIPKCLVTMFPHNVEEKDSKYITPYQV